MKQKTTILLLMLAVSVIGIGMPFAWSIGSGQHQFNQIDTENPDAFCNRCHGTGDSINAELMASGNGIYNGGVRIHSMVKCTDCHAISSGYGTGLAGTKTEHAATVPTCIKCHAGSDPTMGFNVGAELNGTSEAHQGFNDDTACIGCHTSVAVSGSISYTYSGGQAYKGLTIGS